MIIICVESLQHNPYPYPYLNIVFSDIGALNMYLDVDYDHEYSVCSALKYSFHSTTACDKICLISQSGDKLFVSISFISVFSDLVRCICENIHDLPIQMFVPIPVETLKKLMLFLCEGNLASNNPEELQEIVKAAKIFCYRDQSLDYQY